MRYQLRNETPLGLIRTKLRWRAVRRLFDGGRTPSFFGLLADETTSHLIAVGSYEANTCAIIEAAKRAGYSDYLCDVGANLGFITLQTFAGFKKIVCVEANPLVVPVLTANLGLMGVEAAVEPVAIARQAERLELTIPIGNAGGAFVECGAGVSRSALMEKDAALKLSGETRTLAVEGVASQEFFDTFFRSCAAAGLGKGVIKLDIENMEAVALEAIHRVLAASGEDARPVILFEQLRGFDPPVADIRRLGYRLLMQTVEPKGRTRQLFSGRRHVLREAPETWPGPGNYVLVPEEARRVFG